MKEFYKLCLTICVITNLSGCVASQTLPDSNIVKEIINSEVFKHNHTGFALFDIEKQNTIAQYQADKYFIPASNTKLFTFYAGLCVLGDSIPAFKYQISNDTLFFTGTGDPSLLHPDLPASNVLNFLRNWKGKLVYCERINNENISRKYGLGWAWDDYNEYYQPEISPLPVYGNIVRFGFSKSNKLFSVSPKIFTDSIQIVGVGKLEYFRKEHQNIFEVYRSIAENKDVEQDVPYITSTQLAVKLLTDSLQREIGISFRDNRNLPKIHYSIPADSIYKTMLQQSDNMLAEQTMMLCDAVKDSSNAQISTESGINFAKTKFLTDLPDEPIWVDGSGMSRHNLFTPRSIVKLLQKIHAKTNQERLFSLLAIGGKTGTIRNMFKGEEPYIFAKSGSLANNYNLSGYLKTKSGKILAFSFMNNNFVSSTSEIRKEVERIINLVHEKY